MEAVDLERRMPVWTALAELFLDTEPQPADYRRIRAVLARSGYDEKALYDILRQEVVPAFGSNLLSVAGVWGCWTEEEVRHQMLPVIEGRGFGFSGRLLWAFLRRQIEPKWRKVSPFSGHEENFPGA